MTSLLDVIGHIHNDLIIKCHWTPTMTSLSNVIGHTQ